MALVELLALHDLNLWARFADRVALFSDGRTMRVGLQGRCLRRTFWERAYGIRVVVTDDLVHKKPAFASDE
ncbi:MAG: hypothetical protein V3U32_03970 [Anaerolineales bacterium]